MLRIIAFVFAVAFAGHAGAQQAMPREPAIEDVIASQMRAFRADDFERAFDFASPGIRGMFGDADRFGSMVRQGYPMVWKNDEVRFLELREIAGALWQRVMVRDRTGAVHFLDYRMEMGADGWRIDGVQILRAPGVGA